MLIHSLPVQINPKSKVIHLLQITDSHLLENPNRKFAGILPLESLQAVLNDVVEKQKIDLVINTGDIAQEGTACTYKQYLDAVEVLNAPHYYVRGNHDESPYFPSQHDKHDFEIILIDQWCIVLINSQLDAHIYGIIPPKQLEELSQILEKYKDYYVVIGLHHHTFKVGCAWLDQHSLQNADAFLACITPHTNVRAVICGHVHQESTFTHQHIKFLSTPSTFIQFKQQSDEFRFADQPPGYRMLYLHSDGYIETEVYYLAKPTGEIDHNLNKY